MIEMSLGMAEGLVYAASFFAFLLMARKLWTLGPILAGLKWQLHKSDISKCALQASLDNSVSTIVELQKNIECLKTELRKYRYPGEQ
jgi:hypothetical protein